MKKIFAILLISAVITACGGSSTTTTNTTDTTAAADQTAKSAGTSVDTGANNTGVTGMPGAKLMAASDCNTCHKEDVKVVGPALKDIAAKYPATDANIDMLTDKVIKGGKGNWGEVPMSPHPALPPADVKTMVKFILSLKK